jgi:hypothetical protein
MDCLSRQILESVMQRDGVEDSAEANKRGENSAELVPLDHTGKARHHDGLSLSCIGRILSWFLKKLTPFEKIGAIRRNIGIFDKLHIIALRIERIEGKHPGSHLDRLLGKQFHSILF